MLLERKGGAHRGRLRKLDRNSNRLHLSTKAAPQTHRPPRFDEACVSKISTCSAWRKCISSEEFSSCRALDAPAQNANRKLPKLFIYLPGCLSTSPYFKCLEWNKNVIRPCKPHHHPAPLPYRGPWIILCLLLGQISAWVPSNIYHRNLFLLLSFTFSNDLWHNNNLHLTAPPAAPVHRSRPPAAFPFYWSWSAGLGQSNHRNSFGRKPGSIKRSELPERIR